MQGNWPIVILALAVLLIGLIGTVTTSHRPYSVAQNFFVIVMVNGAIMFGGIFLFIILSAVVSLLGKGY